MHKERLVKVNAYVDEGVCPLVEALNECPFIITVDSCEGGDKFAYVYFKFIDEQYYMPFGKVLAKELQDKKIERCNYDIQYYGGGEEPMAKIATYPMQDYILLVSEAIKEAVRKLC